MGSLWWPRRGWLVVGGASKEGMKEHDAAVFIEMEGLA
jgi:hypothetical protein